MRGRAAATGLGRAVALAAVACAALPAPAEAHGLVGRTDLPIPPWLFGWAAAVVIVTSFVTLAVLWPTPRLRAAPGRPLAELPPSLTVAGGIVGVAAFVLVVVSGLVGTQEPEDNLAPTFIYVVFWVGLAVASAVVGDVFRALSPWRAVARVVRWGADLAGAPRRSPRAYPARAGCWPAAAALLAFGWIELVPEWGTTPAVLGALALAYALAQLVGMAIYGTETWSARADGFGVLFSTFARLGPLARGADGRVVLRPPLTGITSMPALPGTTALVCVVIGITTFDGVQNTDLWGDVRSTAAGSAADLVETLGLLASIALVASVFRLGVAGMHSVNRRLRTRRLSSDFAPTLVPIALAYALAHYFSLLVLQGQAIVPLLSDPLGTGADVLGTAGVRIDYGAVSAPVIWYVQVLALICGHVAALMLAHDRALLTWGRAQEAVRSQYWMVVVMVAYAGLGLLLLSAVRV